MEPTTTKPYDAPRCQHIKDSGHSCGSPALRDKAFCYYHERVHSPMPHPRKNPLAFTPHLQCGESIQIAVSNICRAIGLGQLDDKQARTMLSAIRVLKFAFAHRNEHSSEPQVDALTPAMANALTDNPSPLSS